MIPERKFTENEINDLKNFYLKIQQDPNFKVDPVGYIKTSELTVLNYLDNLSDRNRQRFERSLNFIMMRNMFDECSLCLSIVLITMYTLCGKARILIDEIYAILSTIIEALKSILNTEDEITAKLIHILESINFRFSPFTLARIICTQLGKCTDPERRFNFYRPY